MIHAKLCCRSLTEQKEHKDISSKGGCRASAQKKSSPHGVSQIVGGV